MAKKEEIENEFKEFLRAATAVNGFDDRSCRIISTLFLETEEIALEDIAEKIGYSLSAISTSARFLEKLGLISRSKKPGSKKVYLFMDKDIMGIARRMMMKKYENVILVAKEKIPPIIDEYKTIKDKDNLKLQIIKNYYDTVLEFEKIFEKIFSK